MQPLSTWSAACLSRQVMTCTLPGMARFGALALGLSLCACAPPDDTFDEAPASVASQPIVNGQYDTGDPAVVAIAADGYVVCSGTLITPTVVLTAAHCLPPNINSNINDMAVFIGSDVSQAGTLIDAQESWVHPGWSLQIYEHDIGLLRLATAAPVTPIGVNTSPMTNNDVGDPVRVIGFGMTSEGNNASVGRKRQGSTVVGDIYLQFFSMPAQPTGTCSGDSGGTSLMDRGAGEVVTGIHSRSDCVSTAFETRPDYYLTEINAFIGTTEPGCGIDGQCASGCSEPDPDCPCAGDGYCTTVCGDPASDPDCNPACEVDGTCIQDCPIPDPDCAACGADGSCDPSCNDDPDCAPGGQCRADGRCDVSCTDDPDCWYAGNVEEQDYDGDIVESGCQLGHRGGEPSKGHAGAWLLLALAALSLRRRRARRQVFGGRSQRMSRLRIALPVTVAASSTAGSGGSGAATSATGGSASSGGAGGSVGDGGIHCCDQRRARNCCS